LSEIWFLHFAFIVVLLGIRSSLWSKHLFLCIIAMSYCISYEMFYFTGVIENVKLHVDLSVTFLEDFILSRSYKTWNAFFSGSGKSRKV